MYYCQRASELKVFQDLGLEDLEIINSLKKTSIEEFILEARSYICGTSLRESEIDDVDISNFLWGTLMKESASSGKINLNCEEEELRTIVKALFKFGLIREELSLTDQIIRVLTDGNCTLYWELCHLYQTNSAKLLNMGYETLSPISTENFMKILFFLQESLLPVQFSIICSLLLGKEKKILNDTEYEIYQTTISKIAGDDFLAKSIDEAIGGVFLPALTKLPTQTSA